MTTVARDPAWRAPRTLPKTLQSWLPLLAAFAAAIALRGWIGPNSDVTWLITVAEKVLDGQRLYVDLIEINPPASVLLYLPPVALAHLLHLRPELLVDACVFAAACASLWLAGVIADRARLLGGVDIRALALCVAGTLLILPAQTFAEREHIGVLALLPALTVFAVRAGGRSPDRMLAVAAGLGAGIAIAIKPHFAVAIAAALVATSLTVQSWRPLVAIENWAAAAVVGLYAVVIVAAFPMFITQVLPLVNDVYVPIRQPLSELIVSQGVVIWLLIALVLALAAVRGGALSSAPFRVLSAASTGSLLALLIQGKGWPYHAYPAQAFGLLAAATVVCARRDAVLPPALKEPIVRAAAAGVLITVAALSFCWMNRGIDARWMLEPIARSAPRPRLIAITANIAIGHPLVRQLGGTWVGRVCSEWITAGVLARRATGELDATTAARLGADEARERTMLTEDIVRGRPDIIIVEHIPIDWEAWARTSPTLAAELARYSEIARHDGVSILRRAGDG